MVAPLLAQELVPARSRVSAASLGVEARHIPLHLACPEVVGASRRRTL